MKLMIMALSILVISCQTKLDSPEEAVENFIKIRMEKVITKEEVLSKVTGKLKEAIESLSDDEFIQFADLRKFQKNSFKVISKTCQAKKCFVTYTLGYESINEGKATAISESKKIAEVEHIEGKWLIAEVSNLKTYVESLAPIEPLNP
jgi:hypothetical protein